MLAGQTGQAPVRLGFTAMLGILMIIAGRMPITFGRYDEYLERIAAVIMSGWVFVDRIALGCLPMAGHCIRHLLFQNRAVVVLAPAGKN